MAIRVLDQTPTEIRFFPGSDDIAHQMKPEHVEDVVQIFQTPLTGSFNWDYESADGRIRKLYELGKQLNWNAQTDVDWSIAPNKTEAPLLDEMNPFRGFPEYEALSAERQLEFDWHMQSWTLSQFMHGEQGALLVASQLASCAPTYDAKLYAASQTFDEARHVEVFSRYLKEKLGILYPINDHLKVLLDKILTDPRWDLKFIGMQIIVEGLALAAFNNMQLIARDPLLKEIVHLVIRDEARHVTFGVNYLEDFVKSLSDEDKEDRAQFAYEACVVMRERLVATDVFRHFGWDEDAARQQVLSSQLMLQFRNLLFTRIIPNLKRIGLLTDSVREKYDALGILEHENLVDDGEVDWAQMAKPLQTFRSNEAATATP